MAPPDHGNPYAPPQSPHGAPAIVPAGACPRCGSMNLRKPSFTWWGGAVGPRMFDHTLCNACDFGFNGKTGRSNTGPIWAYRAVTWSATIALMAYYWFNR